jgi:hypothetical protein
MPGLNPLALASLFIGSFLKGGQAVFYRNIKGLMAFKGLGEATHKRYTGGYLPSGTIAEFATCFTPNGTRRFRFIGNKKVRQMAHLRRELVQLSESYTAALPNDG